MIFAHSIICICWGFWKIKCHFKIQRLLFYFYSYPHVFLSLYFTIRCRLSDCCQLAKTYCGFYTKSSEQQWVCICLLLLTMYILVTCPGCHLASLCMLGWEHVTSYILCTWQGTLSTMKPLAVTLCTAIPGLHLDSWIRKITPALLCPLVHFCILAMSDSAKLKRHTVHFHTHHLVKTA